MQLAIAEQAAGEPASVRMQSGLLSQTSLQCFLPLILKTFSHPFPPNSWFYIQHATNDFLLKNEKKTNTHTCIKTEKQE